MGLDKIREKKKAKKRNRLIFRSAILAVLIGAVVFSLVSNADKDRNIYGIGDKAPDFKLEQINENNELETIQLSDYEGKGVMLNFWATYCKPCEEEMPYMESLYPEYKEKGIEIIAVNVAEVQLVVDRFVDKYELTFPIPHDKKRQVTELYRILPIPTTFFINPEGIIVDKVEESLSLGQLESYFQEIMPE